MPFTTNKGYSVQTAGSNSGVWGAGSSEALNEGVIELLDDDIGGLQATSLSSSDVTLTAAQARHLIQRFTGTLSANVTVTSPNIGFNVYENATTGDFSVTVQYTGGVGSSVVVPQNTRIITVADGTNGVRAATATPANVTRIWQHTTDDTTERTVDTWAVGDGSGDKATDTIVGDGSGGVAQRRRYIGSTEIERLTTTLALYSILFGVGASFRISPDGYVDFTEVSAPSNPAANVARLYGVDDGSGNTLLAWRDSDGLVTGLRRASQTEMKAATSTSVLVTPGTQHLHPAMPKATGRGRASGGGAIVGTSYGVASISFGSNRYTVTLSSAMKDTNYWVVATALNDGDRMASVDILSTTQFRITIRDAGNGPESDDCAFAVYGELA